MKWHFLFTPVVEVGESKERICLPMTLADETGSIAVKLWDGACWALFGTNTKKMRGLWESGVEDEEERVKVLDSLNASIGGNKKLHVTVKMWSYGYKTITHEAQVNVNAVEDTRK